MTPYNTEDFTPPAPISVVVLRDPRNGSLLHDVQMLIDTGADVTLVPRHAVTAMDLPIDRSRGYELIGFNGSLSIEYPVFLEVLVLGRSFKGYYLSTDQSYGVLGRNILNHLRLNFDGPHLVWGESPAG